MTSRVTSASGPAGAGSFSATDPSTGQPTGWSYSDATAEEIDDALRHARAVLDDASCGDRSATSQLLTAVANLLEDRCDSIMEAAVVESGLPVGRLTSEMGRTTGQLRLLASGRYLRTLGTTPTVRSRGSRMAGTSTSTHERVLGAPWFEGCAVRSSS